GKPLFNVKKSRLLHIAIPSVRTGRMESQSWFQNQRVFRTLHLNKILVFGGIMRFLSNFFHIDSLCSKNIFIFCHFNDLLSLGISFSTIIQHKTAVGSYILQ
ncbi:hypothetical protein, partial [Gluconobacter japonicus]|uniref:hypothetical protein n=1 Tax=Gluconobacter japonicus TaxID=376620 RepID=UPI0024E08F73